MPKPAPTVATNDNFDKDSDASEDNEQPKNRGGVSMLGTGEKEMSALEKAVEARRKKMENSYATGDAEKESEVRMIILCNYLCITYYFIPAEL